ncbi:MAG: hypothetical protein WBA45_03135 [Microthrixaceae bacterium]
MPTTRHALRPPHNGNQTRHRALLAVVAIIVAVLGLITPTAPAGAATGNQNAVAAINTESGSTIEPRAAVSPGHIEVSGPLFDDVAVVSLVTPSETPSGVTHMHHSDPKFMGGAPKQPLTKLTDVEHKALHKDLNDFLRQQTDDFGRHMRPQRGNSGQIIRRNFTRDERLDALARFYSGPGAKYADAAEEFFTQHPGLRR